MADRSPSFVLRQAAQRLRETAQQIEDEGSGLKKPAGSVLASLTIAEPLAAMLESAADHFKIMKESGLGTADDPASKGAFSIARLILEITDGD